MSLFQNEFILSVPSFILQSNVLCNISQKSIFLFILNIEVFSEVLLSCAQQVVCLKEDLK